MAPRFFSCPADPSNVRPSFGLNKPQSEAVHYMAGPCLVLAGAGSGKTRVITQKIAHLIENCGYESRNIAALTFTNKAALEMQERIAKLLKDPKQAKHLTVSTFHSLGVKILRQESKHLGLKDRFSIMDSDDCFGARTGGHHRQGHHPRHPECHLAVEERPGRSRWPRRTPAPRTKPRRPASTAAMWPRSRPTRRSISTT
jgi:hypothetical protein